MEIEVKGKRGNWKSNEPTLVTKPLFIAKMKIS